MGRSRLRLQRSPANPQNSRVEDNSRDRLQHVKLNPATPQRQEHRDSWLCVCPEHRSKEACLFTFDFCPERDTARNERRSFGSIFKKARPEGWLDLRIPLGQWLSWHIGGLNTCRSAPIDVFIGLDRRNLVGGVLFIGVAPHARRTDEAVSDKAMRVCSSMGVTYKVDGPLTRPARYDHVPLALHDPRRSRQARYRPLSH